MFGNLNWFEILAIYFGIVVVVSIISAYASNVWYNMITAEMDEDEESYIRPSQRHPYIPLND